MKTEVVYIQGLDKEITFLIGQNKNDNFDIIDMADSEDLWFHANNISSCHVVACLPEDIDKKDLKYIIKTGASLCKNNTNKLKILKDVEIVYTQIKNIVKTSTVGCVEIKNEKFIRIK
jgi:predicted ribosome quality control (RQC) complex YloA/Tae2 family protein